ncbi:hypothetical protein Tco_0970762 [Tanacetum coccineum]
MTCAQHADNDTYSASAIDIVVQSCFLELQLTSFSPKNYEPPEVLLQSSLHPAWSASEYAISSNAESSDTIGQCYRTVLGCNSRPLSDEEKDERNAAKTHASTKLVMIRRERMGGNLFLVEDFLDLMGSFNGRGGFSNVQVNDGKRYVPVKNMAKGKTSDMEGMKKQEVDKETRKDQTTQVKHIAQNNFSLNNRFSALTDEEQDDKLNEWQGIKINIDVGYDMRVLIDEEESVKLPQDLQEYYKTKCDGMKKSA